MRSCLSHATQRYLHYSVSKTAFLNLSLAEEIEATVELHVDSSHSMQILILASI